MIFPISLLISYISQWFTLFPGDVILTGTPKGVGRLALGDHLNAKLNDLVSAQATVT
jgi:2-keto-4-pentenoate hydratase/2-oxohepta-3-ene-1,7-dioic acid hydratase in catechol pathway